MGHQPFEMWLLEEDDLKPEQRQELAAHLMVCAECLELHNALTATSALLLTARPASPAPGFTLRWKENLARKRERQNQRQIWKFFLSVFIGALISFGGLIAVLNLTNFSITDLLVPAATFIANLFSLAGDAQVALGTNISTPVSVILWVMAASSVCLLIFGWVYVLWRISSRGVKKNEESI
jgi:hypothetical protein